MYVASFRADNERQRETERETNEAVKSTAPDFGPTQIIIWEYGNAG